MEAVKVKNDKTATQVAVVAGGLNANLAQLFDITGPLAPGLKGFKQIVTELERVYYGNLVTTIASFVTSGDITEVQAVKMIEFVTASQQADMGAYSACTTLEDFKFVFIQHWRNIYISFYWLYYYAGALPNFKGIVAVIKGFTGTVNDKSYPNGDTLYPSLNKTMNRIGELIDAVIARNQVLANQKKDTFFEFFGGINDEVVAVYVANGGSSTNVLYDKMRAKIVEASNPVFAIPTYAALLASQPPKQVQI